MEKNSNSKDEKNVQATSIADFEWVNDDEEYDVRCYVHSKHPVNVLKDHYLVKDQKVFCKDKKFKCSCDDFSYRAKNCEHIIAVKRYLKYPAVLKLDAQFKEEYDVSGSVENKLNTVVSQMKRRFAGINVYWLKDLYYGLPTNDNTVNNWTKKVAGLTASEFFKREGLLKEIEWFDILYGDDIPLEEMFGKTVLLVQDKENTSDSAATLFRRCGINVVSSLKDSFDFVYFSLSHSSVLHYHPDRNIRKVPKDQNGLAYYLMTQYLLPNCSFKILSEDSISALWDYDLLRCRTREEREQMGIIYSDRYPSFEDAQKDDHSFSVFAKFDKNDLPTFDEKKVYRTIEWVFDRDWPEPMEVKDLIPGSIEGENDVIEKAEKIKAKNEIENFNLLCNAVTLPKFKQYVISHAEKKKNGTLAIRRIQTLAVLPYVSHTEKYYALVAKNVDDYTIEVSVRKQDLLRYYDGGDYTWGELPKCKTDPMLTAIAKNRPEADFPYRNMPGYCYVDSKDRCIPEIAFVSDSDIVFLEISNNILSVSSNAFQGCKNLKYVKMGGVISTIGSKAFSDCKNLESVSVYNNEVKFDYRCFENCDSLKRIVFDDVITAEAFGRDCFSGCEKMEGIFYPGGKIDITEKAPEQI